MNPFRKPEGRFALEALAIVAAAAVPGYLHVAWKHVLVLVVVVLLLSVLLEVIIALRLRRRRKTQEPEALPAVEVQPEPPALEAPAPPPPAPRVVVPPRPALPAPEQTEIERVVAQVFSDEPAPEPAPPPPSRRPAPPPPPPPPSSGPWKLAQLERALRAQPNPDPELLYMIGYLRDYADADGTLPAEFDELVRDAFGPVLGISR